MDTAPTRRRPLGACLRAHASAGFTLVEVMVASFVMLFAISSAIIVMQSGFRALDTARKTTLAAQIMQSEMERIRMLSWSRVSTESSGKIDLGEIFPQNTEVEKQILAQMEVSFTAMRTVTPLTAYASATGEPEIVEIGVKISWKGIDGVPHERSSSTRYCKNGLYAYYYTDPSA